MKLHLGCGSKILQGYVNVDVRKELGCDLIEDVKHLKSISSNSIKEIYACHVLEHFSRFEYIDVLKKWYDVLEKGGILKISVPDLEQVFIQYSKGVKLKTLMGFLYGGQTYEQNYHYVGFDFKTLEEDLISIGFKEVGRWDWRKTEHSEVDDYSQCYLPHMDKERGTLMSLNVYAIK